MTTKKEKQILSLSSMSGWRRSFGTVSWFLNLSLRISRICKYVTENFNINDCNVVKRFPNFHLENLFNKDLVYKYNSIFTVPIKMSISHLYFFGGVTNKSNVNVDILFSAHDALLD